MALLENDVSWHVLRRIVRDWAGSAAELEEVRSLAGGSINNTLLLTARDGLRAVLKISAHRVNHELAREAHQLKHLHKLGIPVPRVHAFHMASLESPDTWLLMEHIDAVDLHVAKESCTADEYNSIQEELAELCLNLHDTTHRHYHRDGEEDSPRFDSWPRFFRHIYDSIWQDVEKAKLLSPRTHKRMAHIHERLEELLDHEDKPRLIHGDFWSANVMVRSNGDGRLHVVALLDPNLKYAHAESELAYLELFHTITPAFLKHYQRKYHIPDAYHHHRRDVYHLYDLLDHVHLFGHEYVKPFTATLRKLEHVS